MLILTVYIYHLTAGHRRLSSKPHLKCLDQILVFPNPNFVEYLNFTVNIVVQVQICNCQQWPDSVCTNAGSKPPVHNKAKISLLLKCGWRTFLLCQTRGFSTQLCIWPTVHMRRIFYSETDVADGNFENQLFWLFCLLFVCMSLCIYYDNFYRRLSDKSFQGHSAHIRVFRWISMLCNSQKYYYFKIISFYG